MLLKQILAISLTLLFQPHGTVGQVYNLPSQCYPILDYANEIVHSIGLDRDALCPSTGLFSNALAKVTSCMNSYSGSGDRQVATLLDTADKFCKSAVASEALANATSSWYSSSVCCGTDTGAQLLVRCPTTRTYVPSSDPTCITFVLGKATVAGVTTTIGSTARSGQSMSPTVSDQSPGASSTRDAQFSNPNTGLTVGAAVGASLGFVILVLVTFFIFWHRRQRKREFERERAVEQVRTPEKAQLHSDDVRPDPKELIGSPLVMVRSVGGLEEMEARPWRGHEISTSQSGEGEVTSTDRTLVHSHRS